MAQAPAPAFSARNIPARSHRVSKASPRQTLPIVRFTHAASQTAPIPPTSSAAQKPPGSQFHHSASSINARLPPVPRRRFPSPKPQQATAMSSTNVSRTPARKADYTTTKEHPSSDAPIMNGNGGKMRGGETLKRRWRRRMPPGRRTS